MNRKKKWILGAVFLFVVAVGIFIAVKIKSDNSDSGGGNGKKCKKAFDTCETGTCCGNLTCTQTGQHKVCLNTSSSPKMSAFHLKTDSGKYLVWDMTNSKFDLQESADWKKNWWSWDGDIIRFMEADSGKVKSLCMSSNVASQQAVLFDNKCSNQSGKLLITNQDGVGGIFTSDYRYSAFLKIKDGLVVFQWLKSVDVPSGSGTVFKIENPDNSKCIKVGEKCGGKGQPYCCPPFKNCQDGKCVSCLGHPPKCKPGEKPICGSNSNWSCVSQCDLTKKDKVAKTCKGNEVISCIQDKNGNYNWQCVSHCADQDFPSGCPQSVCVQDGDKWVYKCLNTCDDKSVNSKPPSKEIMSQLKGYKAVKDTDCVGDAVNKKCYVKGNDYKVLYYDCDHDNWSVEQTCGISNKPTCDGGEEPVCISMDPAFCDKKGKEWVCPSKSDNWCAFASYHDLQQRKAVYENDKGHTIPIYFDGDKPAYPTISYNNCSIAGGNTTFYKGKNLNPKGFVEDDGKGNYTFYPSDKSFKYQGKNMDYSDKYVYYKPSETSKNQTSPFCMMKKPCENDGTFTIQKGYSLVDHPNFSTKDPRTGNKNAPPTSLEAINIG